MKLLPAAVAAVLAASCASPEVDNHWHAHSIVTGVQRSGFGYDRDRDGSYWNRLGEDSVSIWTTFRQHMLGSVYDPRNPLMGDVGRRSPPPAPPDNPYDSND